MVEIFSALFLFSVFPRNTCSHTKTDNRERKWKRESETKPMAANPFAAIPLPSIAFNTQRGQQQQQQVAASAVEGEEEPQEEGSARPTEPIQRRRVQKTPDELVFEALLLHGGPRATRKQKTRKTKGSAGVVSAVIDPPRGANADQILVYLQKHHAAARPETWLADRLQRLVGAGAIVNENAQLVNVRPLFRLTPATFGAVLNVCKQRVFGDEAASVDIASKQAARHLVGAAAEALSRGKRKARKAPKDTVTRCKQKMRKIRRVANKMRAKHSKKKK